MATVEELAEVPKICSLTNTPVCVLGGIYTTRTVVAHVLGAGVIPLTSRAVEPHPTSALVVSTLSCVITHPTIPAHWLQICTSTGCGVARVLFLAVTSIVSTSTVTPEVILAQHPTRAIMQARLIEARVKLCAILTRISCKNMENGCTVNAGGRRRLICLQIEWGISSSPTFMADAEVVIDPLVLTAFGMWTTWCLQLTYIHILTVTSCVPQTTITYVPAIDAVAHPPVQTRFISTRTVLITVIPVGDFNTVKV